MEEMMGDSRELRDQERDRLFRDMQRQRDEALATLARLADQHKREMSESVRILNACRATWRRQQLALNDCRSWLLGRLEGVTGPMMLTVVEEALVKSGYTVDDSPEAEAAVRARFGMGPSTS
jgi:hypothetical protein